MLARRLRELTLWIGALVGLVAITAGVATTFFGFSFLVFRSGSMEPSISTGGLALSRTVSADEISAGDVVSVMTSAGDRVTHRVVSTTLREDTASLVLQGDANGAPDSDLYEVATVERVVGSVPHAGYVLAYLLTPAGLIGATCLALMVVVLGFGDDTPRSRTKRADARRPNGPPPRHRAGRTTTRSVVLVGAACVTLAGSAAGIGGAVSGTWATFTDRATVATGAFTSATVPTPVLTCTEGAGANVTVAFATVAFPTTVTYSANLTAGASVTGLGVTGTGNSRSVPINQSTASPGSGFTLFGGSVDYTVTVTVGVTGSSWTESSTTRIRSSRPGLLGGSNDITCL